MTKMSAGSGATIAGGGGPLGGANLRVGVMNPLAKSSIMDATRPPVNGARKPPLNGTMPAPPQKGPPGPLPKLPQVAWGAPSAAPAIAPSSGSKPALPGVPVSPVSRGQTPKTAVTAPPAGAPPVHAVPMPPPQRVLTANQATLSEALDQGQGHTDESSAGSARGRPSSGSDKSTSQSTHPHKPTHTMTLKENRVLTFWLIP